MNKSQAYVEQLASRLRNGDVAALARGISLVDGRSEAGNSLYRTLRAFAGHAEVVGITGPPGAGKSTLINALISELRAQDKRVAVVAVDPSSPISGGSVLGDRTRMGKHTDDPGVFIRSLSARGHLGGLSASVLRVVDLVDAAGWDVVILETVGAGQSETEVAEVADINVVVNAPGLGDDVQAIKAGILEIADILVVNKSDSPLAIRTVKQLQAMLQLRREEAKKVPVISTVATEASGVDELVVAIEKQSRSKFDADRNARLQQRARRQLAQQASEQVKQWLLQFAGEEMDDLLASVIEGRSEPDKAIAKLLALGFGAK